MRYPIAIERGTDDTAWGVVVPDLPGCFSAGDTLEEAIDNAAEAIALHLEELIEEGNPIPQPSAVDTYADEYKGWDWAYVNVPVESLDTKRERINITIPRKVLRRIDAFVGTGNRSSFFAEAAIKVISAAVNQQVVKTKKKVHKSFDAYPMTHVGKTPAPALGKVTRKQSTRHR